MGPDYCGNCAKISAPCSMGLKGANGRRCPQVEHACKSHEGQLVWDAVRRASGWTGGGMTPLRIDRAAIRARLDGVPGWIVEVLLDAFEPAALAAQSKAREKQQKADKGRGGEPGSSPHPESEHD